LSERGTWHCHCRTDRGQQAASCNYCQHAGHPISNR
jgi:hypothetical protein